MTTLRTTRLTLDPLRVTDAEAVASYAATEEFVRHLPLPLMTPSDSARWVSETVAAGFPSEGGNRVFAIREGSGAPLIGTLRLGFREPSHFSGDIGYGLHPWFRGRGLMTEAVIEVLRHAFDDLGWMRVHATASVPNMASRSVLSRAGMRQEGILRRHRLIRGEWRDSVLFAALSDDPRSSSTSFATGSCS
jgi:RimJ/RimL family protein N-acetyltransferase